MTSPEPDPFGWVGSTIDGQFAVESIAGIGGYGTVYRATHLGLDAPVAIKCLHLPSHVSLAERESFVAKFRTEARLLHRLSRQTASIVQALDIGAATAPNGRWTPYIVMEWLEGETLEDDLSQRRAAAAPPRTLSEALDLLDPVAEALSVAHADNVSHRDVKPANLFLSNRTNGPRMKVLDFGIAKIFAETPSLSAALIDTTGPRVLTPMYAAPEQFLSDYGATGPWTDVFSLTLILIEVASGRRVLSGDNLIELCVSSTDAHARKDLLWGAAGARAGVASVLRRALAPRPVDRFRNVTELWSALLDAQRTTSADALLSTLDASELPPIPPHHATPRGLSTTVTATAEVKGSKEPITVSGENRVCTVMLVDLASVTELSGQLDGEELKELLDRCRGVVDEHIESLGGMIERSAGDRTLAVFGVQRASEGDAECAVLAALRIQAALTRLALPRAARGARVSARVGINTGRVFMTLARGRVRPELSVIGDPVTIATRLVEAAPAGAIALGRDTHRQVIGRINVAPLPPIEVPGRDEPLSCYRVLFAVAFRASFVRSDFCGIETKLVGRTAERQQIAEALDTVISERTPRVVTLVGAPGVGRSRLLADVFSSLTVRRERFFVLTAQCSPIPAPRSYSLVAALARRRFDIREGDSPARIRRKLRVGLRWFRTHSAAQGEAAPYGLSDDQRDDQRDDQGDALHDDLDPAELDAALSQVETILGVAAPAELASQPITLEETGRFMKQRIAAAIALLFRFVAHRMPIVLLCDDLQWADDASLDLLSDLAERAGDLPMIMVGSARPELLERRPEWGLADGVHERVVLAPLARRHVEEMIRDRLQRLPSLSPGVVRTLAERAEGNPLILEELLHLLIDDGAIEVRDDDPWAFHEARLSTLTLPPTIQRIVQARLDRLDPEARLALAQAAVVGRTFWIGAVEHLRRAHPECASGAPLEVLLARLRDRQLIRMRDHSTIPGEQEATFAESATHEVAYETLPLKVRRSLHLLVAGWIEQQTADGLGPDAALIALHYDRGGAAARAAAAYIRAGAHAAFLGENAEALRHLERARAIQDQTSTRESEPSSAEWRGEDRRVASFRDRVRLRLDLGDALRRAGRLDDAERAYDEARAHVIRRERRPHAALDPLEALCWDARIDARLALVHKVRGSIADACALIERAIACATEAGIVDETPAMYALLALLLCREHRPEQAWRAAWKGLRICRSRSRRDERWRENVGWLLLGVAGARAARHRTVSAERVYAQITRLLPEAQHPHVIGMALNGAAGARLARGDLLGARERLVRSLEVNERVGDLHQMAVAHKDLAEVELRRGENALAVSHARCAVELGEQADARSDLADLQRSLAEATLACGELEAALDAGQRALALAEADGRIYLSEVLPTLARIVARAAQTPSSAAAVRGKAARALGLLRESLARHRTDEDDALRRSIASCRALLATVSLDG